LGRELGSVEAGGSAKKSLVLLGPADLKYHSHAVSKMPSWRSCTWGRNLVEITRKQTDSHFHQEGHLGEVRHR